MNTELTTMIAEARQWLGGDTLDAQSYERIEAYVLKNGSRLAGDADYVQLKALLRKVAAKYNLPSVEAQQENFGLNSCAQ